jgi:predicted nucleic acid-binding protein
MTSTWKKVCELLLSFRDLKRRKKMPSADFHHLASAIGEKADFFVTIDEKHLLSLQTREAMAGLIRILNPEEALSYFF